MLYIAGDGAVGVTADNGGARWRWIGAVSPVLQTPAPGTHPACTPGLHTRHTAMGLTGCQALEEWCRQVGRLRTNNNTYKLRLLCRWCSTTPR